MPATYEPIATTTLNSTATTITFSSIPSTYTDLRLVVTYGATSNYYLGLRFNGDTGTNYSFTRLIGNGSTATSSSSINQTYANIDTNYGPSSTIPALGTADIFSYAGSTNKTVLATSSADLNGSGGVTRRVSLWRSASAINTILIFDVTGSGTFSIGTAATLYGIKAA